MDYGICCKLVVAVLSSDKNNIVSGSVVCSDWKYFSTFYVSNKNRFIFHWIELAAFRKIFNGLVNLYTGKYWFIVVLACVVWLYSNVTK